MKAFNITPVRRSGGTSALILGEGSQQVVVPCPTRFEGLGIEYVHDQPHLIGARSGPGWIARICTRGAGKGAGNGYVSVPHEHAERVFVMAHAGGQHDPKGKASSWHDYVLTLDDDTFLRVKNAGDTAHFLYFGSAGVQEVPPARAAAFGQRLGLTLSEGCAGYHMLPERDGQ